MCGSHDSGARGGGSGCRHDGEGQEAAGATAAMLSVGRSSLTQPPLCWGRAERAFPTRPKFTVRVKPSRVSVRCLSFGFTHWSTLSKGRWMSKAKGAGQCVAYYGPPRTSPGASATCQYVAERERGAGLSLCPSPCSAVTLVESLSFMSLSLLLRKMKQEEQPHGDI